VPRLLPRRAALAAFAVLAASACAPVFGDAGPVDVTVVDLVPAVGRGTGQAWGVTFDVDNRSARDLAIRAMDVEMRLNGSDLGRGSAEAPFRLPAYGTARVELTIEGTWLGLARQMLNLADRQSFDWQVRGTLTAEGPSPETLHFRNDGTLLDDAADW
jgi:hypothetical protein